MPGSLKLKFTVVFTAIMAFTLILFSSVLYGIINQHQPMITREKLVTLFEEHPNLPRQIVFAGQENREEILVEIGEMIEAQQRLQYNKLIFAILIPTIIVGGGFAYLTAGYLVDPIEKLRRDVERLDVNDVSRRLPTRSSSTEIEYLQESFNKLLNKVESAFDAQEEFIQDAAHELRTPLAAIKAHLELIKESKYKSRKELMKAIDTLDNMNQSLISLSEDLLFLDRRNQPKKEKIALHELMDDVLELLNPRIKKEKVTIRKKYSFKKVVLADPKSLSRAIENVIENAIKYSKIDPEIIISLAEDDGYAVLSIKDNGIGISKNDQSKVFERFYRGDEASEVDGSGLGLAIVKKVIEDHEGEVTLKSKSGRGTTISIAIPIGG